MNDYRLIHNVDEYTIESKDVDLSELKKLLVELLGNDYISILKGNRTPKSSRLLSE